MGAVVEQRDRYVRMSIARLAEEFGMGRDTVSKRLAAFNVRPDGKRNGYPVYRLRDACPALLAQAENAAEEDFDPRNLPPEARKAWYQSEIARLNVETTARQLIPAAEVEAEQARLVKGLMQFVDTLGDQLERDAGIPPEAVVRVGEIVDRQREALYRLIVEDEMPGEATG